MYKIIRNIPNTFLNYFFFIGFIGISNSYSHLNIPKQNIKLLKYFLF